MRSLSPTDPRDPSGGLRATTNPAAESLQMSYCLVNEEDIDTPAEQQRHPRRYKSPHRSKRSPAPSHAKLQPSSQKHPECPAADPSLPKTNPEAQALRRESSQTVTPGSSSLAAPHSPLLTRPSPAMTPSLPDDSISDISYSPSRHDSPVASFSELPLSRVPSVPEFNGVSDSSAPFPDSSEQELVMPVLTVPHRRPFTETGKSIGSLKILVAGRKGTGKSSLIRAILQCCEHIVHVEPEKDAPSAKGGVHGGHRNEDARQPRISEIHASTMPRPPWWSPCDGEDAGGLEDPNFVDTVLDTNICFVDTPGHDVSTDLSDSIALSRQYIESHLSPHLSSSVDDSDMLRILGGSGGSLVSAVLYLISPSGITEEDHLFFSTLHQVTNVIPVVSHADTLSVTEVAAIKESVAQALADNNLRPFTFSVSGAPDDTPPVYAVSSLPGAEFDLTDASLLVNSEYLQPLITTDLARLVDDIFCANGASWLRHSAAKVYLDWRRRHVQFGYGMDLCLAPKLPVGGWPSAGFPWNDTCSGEALLDDWAAALRRSLENSACNWRSTQLVQAVRPGELAVVRRHERAMRKAEVVAHQDPLGLLQMLGGVRNRGQAVMEVAGTLGALGALGTLGAWMWKTTGPD